MRRSTGLSIPIPLQMKCCSASSVAWSRAAQAAARLPRSSSGSGAAGLELDDRLPAAAAAVGVAQQLAGGLQVAEAQLQQRHDQQGGGLVADAASGPGHGQRLLARSLAAS